MAEDYGTLIELKDLMADTSFGSSYDSTLQSLITRASRMFDNFVKRWPGYFYASEEETRYFDGSGSSSLWIDEIASVPSAVLVAELGKVDNMSGSGGDYADWTNEAWFLWPDNASSWGMPYRRIDLDQYQGTKVIWPKYRRAVKITAKFGYAASPPADIKQACMVQAMRWFKRAQQAFQDAGAIVELGQLHFVKDLDPDIKLILSNYHSHVTI